MNQLEKARPVSPSTSPTPPGSRGWPAPGAAHVRPRGSRGPARRRPLILDGLRRRPHYFDGRFLTGSDLTRDQDYVRQRQADMARASGAGIISGLQVRSFSLARGQTIRIEPGVGLTPSGDVVMLTRRRDVPLLDLPLSIRPDAAAGLREEPRVPLGRRTGLFILALRPVEFTANPIAAYPRTITGRRTVEDGDIIEATAITLIPYPETSGAATLNGTPRVSPGRSSPASRAAAAARCRWPCSRSSLGMLDRHGDGPPQTEPTPASTSCSAAGLRRGRGASPTGRISTMCS